MLYRASKFCRGNMFSWRKNRSEPEKIEPVDTSPAVAGAKLLGSVKFKSPSMGLGITIGTIWVTEREGVIVHPDKKVIALLKKFDQDRANEFCRELAGEFLHCFRGGDTILAFNKGPSKFKPSLEGEKIVISPDELSGVDYIIRVMSMQQAHFVPSK